jgi:hypothetical protein
MDLDDEQEEQEVTFLLRLRPTPSPPASRRRKSSIDSSLPVAGSGWDVVVERQGNTPPPHRRASLESRPSSGTSWDLASQPPVALSATPQRRSNADSRPNSGALWDLASQPPVVPSAPPQRRSSVESRPNSCASWDLASQPPVFPSAPPQRRSNTDSRPNSGASWARTSQSPVVSSAPPQRRAGVESRPNSGTLWDTTQPSVVPSAPPQRCASVDCRSTSGTAWDITSSTSSAPNAPPSSEVRVPWVCPMPQHAWAVPYGPQFPNVNWTQPFPIASQLGSDYRHWDPSALMPQTLPFQEDYRHHFEAPDMFFHPLSVENTNCQQPDTLTRHPQPYIPTHVQQDHSDVSEHLPRRGNEGPETSCGVESWSSLLSQRSLASLRAISSSHGNLLTINNHNVSSDKGFVPVRNITQSGIPKERVADESVSVNCNFVNSFRRHSVPSAPIARALSWDQLQRCGVPEEPSHDTRECPVDADPRALPPRPPKPAPFYRGGRQRPRITQQTTAPVRTHLNVALLIARSCR